MVGGVVCLKYCKGGRVGDQWVAVGRWNLGATENAMNERTGPIFSNGVGDDSKGGK